MNKFLTTALGGMPLNNDDFVFIQDAWRSGFQGVYSDYGVTPAEAVIISGFVRSDAGIYWSYTAGYVYMGGAILVAAGGSILKEGGGEAHYAYIETTNASTGTKNYENGSTVETHSNRIIRVANYTIGAQPANSILFSEIDVRRVVDLVALDTFTRLPALEEAYDLASGSPSARLRLGSGFTDIGSYIKRVGNTVHLKINVYVADMTTYTTAFTLYDPLDRPLQSFYTPIVRTQLENDCIIEVLSTGVIRIIRDSTTAFSNGTFTLQLSYQVD